MERETDTERRKERLAGLILPFVLELLTERGLIDEEERLSLKKTAAGERQ